MGSRVMFMVIVVGFAACAEPEQAALEQGGASLAVQDGVEFVISWGAGPTDVGLERGGEERRAFGPDSLALGIDGSVGILDGVNGRIQVYGPDGRHRRSIPVSRLARDLLLAADGGALVLVPSAGELQRIDGNGRILERLRLPAGLAPVIGLDRDDDGNAILRTMYQDSLLVKGEMRLQDLEPGLEALDGQSYQVVSAASGGDETGRTRPWSLVRITEPAVSGDGTGTEVLIDNGPAASATRLLEARDGLFVLLQDHLSDEGRNAVRRSLVVLTAHGDVVLERGLGSGTVPFRAARLDAFGRLATMEPLHEGVKIKVIRLDRKGGVR